MGSHRVAMSVVVCVYLSAPLDAVFLLQERIKEKKKNHILNRKKMPKKIQILRTLKMLK